LLVARDKVGEKPLFYSQDPDRLIISSDSRGIRKFKPSVLDGEQIRHYFYLRAALPGKTFLKGIREWKPNRLSTIYQHSTFRWDFLGNAEIDNIDPESSTFKLCLDAAVQRQFYANVPVGIQLSGGADSSLLYALWYQRTGTKLPAYTIQIEKAFRKKYADGNAAIRFLQKYPADHSLIEIDQEIFLANWEKNVRSIDGPVGDSAGFLSWMIGKEAKKKSKY
jgi:asparagine synthase (glutamine-hydrolysing)